jgi:hypothetical protein
VEQLRLDIDHEQRRVVARHQFRTAWRGMVFGHAGQNTRLPRPSASRPRKVADGPLERTREIRHNEEGRKRGGASRCSDKVHPKRLSRAAP